jgi:hypothetical protein
MIHGDGEYLYHDIQGDAFVADEVALAEMRHVADQNPMADVFIFHQKPRKHILFVFPVPDGEFFYYHNGLLLSRGSYWRDPGDARYASERELYSRYCATKGYEKMSVFVYCGHEIPEYGGLGYDASFPDRPFTVEQFVSGLGSFAPDSSKFDLMVLSSCFGGTPYTIGALGSLARYVVASPENLHLSYFDLGPLAHLDQRPGKSDVPGLALTFASHAFERLTADLETAVSVSVYTIDSVQEFVNAVQDAYDHTLASFKADVLTLPEAREHCDCAELPAYVLPSMHTGLQVFYRPAHFGRLQHKLSHSGWECWKERETQSNARNR